MIPILLILAAGVLQEPKPAPRPAPVPARAASTPRQAVAEDRSIALESTVTAISDIGVKVAELRSAFELYRRAAYNEPDGALMERATMYGSSCRALAGAVERGQRALCRSCLAQRIQTTVDQYRAYLPTLQRMGQACASRVDALKSRGTATTQSKALRDDVDAASTRMLQTLRLYEARLQPVRVHFGWTEAVTPPPRRGR